MGTRGPLPHPAKLQRLRSNPGKRVLMQPAPVTPGTPTMPPTLGEVGQKLWRELTATLRHRKTLAKEDGNILEATALAYQDLTLASQAIAKKGSVYESATTNGVMIRPRPECQLRSDAFKRYVRCLEALGLTPASRQRLQINAIPEKDDDDPLGTFLRDNPHPTYQGEGE